MQDQNTIRPVAYGLAFYLLMGVFDSLNISEIGSLLKIAAFIPLGMMVFQWKDLRLRFHSLLFMQIAFWLLALVSLFYTISFDRTFSASMTLTLNLVLVLILGVMVPYNDAELKLLQKAMLLGCWLQILMTLIFADFSAAGRLTLRFGQTTQDQNNNNTFFLYAFSYHLYHFLGGRRKIHLLPVLLMLFMVLFSGSRGALLAIMLTFFFQICIYFKESRHPVRNILLVGMLLLFAVFAFDLFLAQLPESVAVRYSWDYLAEKGTTGRTRIWTYLWKQFSEASMLRMLFGHGYGTTTIVNQMSHQVAHNLYLDNLITLGILGVILQLTSQIMVMGIFWKKKKYALLGAYVGMVGMCMSLSLTASKPLWNLMLIALALDCNPEEQAAHALIQTKHSDV